MQDSKDLARETGKAELSFILKSGSLQEEHVLRAGYKNLAVRGKV